MGLFRYERGDSDAVMCARFELGRWPTTWREAQDAFVKYSGDPFMRPLDRPVQITPLPGDTCRVVFHLRDLLGIPYTEQVDLAWTPDEAKRIAEGEWHTDEARLLAGWYCDWVREENGGKVTPSMSGIAGEIRRWPEVKSVALEAAAPAGQNDSTEAGPYFIVDYKDGSRRAVPIGDELAHPHHYLP